MRKAFKVWCKNKNEWEKDACFLSESGGLFQMKGAGILTPCRLERHIICWVSDKTDINGNYIATGDIIKYTRKNWKCYGHPQDGTDLIQYSEIFWDKEKNSFRFREEGKFLSGGGWSGILEWDDSRASENIVEIIGNVFETPTLLSEKMEELKKIEEELKCLKKS